MTDAKSLKSFKINEYKDKPAVLWTFVIENVVKFLPESERPNVSEVVQVIKKRVEESLLANKDFKGCRIPVPFNCQSAEWMYNNWMPDRGDVLVATYPKAGRIYFHFIQ